MSNIRYIANVLNQKGSPAIFEDTFANRPSAGYTGRIFISTDTFVIQRDNGTGWDSLGGGGISGTGAAGQVTFWTGASAVSGDNGLFWDNTNKRLGINTITPGVRLDIHGTGVIAQLNGTTTNNAYLDFQNAGTTQWRVGNNYNGGSRLFQVIDQVGSKNILTYNNLGQTGFNLPGTTFFSTNWAYQLHGLIGQTWDFSMVANNVSGGGFINHSVLATRNNTFGSYGATLSGDQLYQLAFFGSSGTGYTFSGGGLIVTQNGSVGSNTPIDLRLVASNPSGVVTEIGIRNAGYGAINKRWNVNGATDNALFELNNNGNLYTGGLSPTILTVAVNTTMARTVTGYYCTASLTLTLPSAASLNNIYWIIAASGVTVTVNRAGSDDILNLAGASVTTISITSNQRAMFYVGGGTRTFLISQA